MRLRIVFLCTFLASILMLSNILPYQTAEAFKYQFLPRVKTCMDLMPPGSGSVCVNMYSTDTPENDKVAITVESIVDNVSSDIMDTIEVSLRSDSDAKGLLLKIIETTPNSGIFKTGFSLTDTGRSSGTTLRVSLGDTITAEFRGVRTNGSIGGDVDLKSNTKDVRIKEEDIKTAPTPTPSNPDTRPNVEFYDLRFTDSFGNPIKEIQPNQQAIITATLVNKQENQKDFTFIVNCNDKNGKVVWSSSTTGSINPGAKIEPSLSLVLPNAVNYKCTGMIEIPNYKSQLASVSTSITVKQKVTEDVQKATDKAVSEGSSSSGSDVRTKNFNSEEVAMINNIISKLKVVSQSNSEVQKLLSQLEEVWNQPEKTKAQKEQSEADAAKEKNGLNAVNVKLAISKLKDELKSNPKALKLLKAVEAEISKVAKVSSDKAIDLADINKKIEKLRKELTKSNPEALKSVRELTDTIEQIAENHNTTRSNKIRIE